MSTTRSQKRKNNQQEAVENVSEGFVSPAVAENSCSLDQDVDVVGPSRYSSVMRQTSQNLYSAKKTRQHDVDKFLKLKFCQENSST